MTLPSLSASSNLTDVSASTSMDSAVTLSASSDASSAQLFPLIIDDNDDQLFPLSFINASRGVLSLIAVIVNFLVVLSFAKHKNLRKSKINWAVCNLMLSNVLMCSTIAVYSFMKLYTWQTPRSQCGCLALNWCMVAVSFGPTWSVALMTFLRATFYCQNDTFCQKVTLKRFMLIRSIIALLDLAVATLIIRDVRSIFEPLPFRCAYQTLLDRSIIYVTYNLFVGCCLLIGGLSSLITRTKLRRKILKIQRHMPTSVNNEKPQIKQTDSNTDTIFNISTTYTITTDEENLTPPSLLWKKPKFIVLFIILGVLFVLPRVAFITKDKRTFFPLATMCPPVIALIFALIFLTIPKDFRQITFDYLKKIFNVSSNKNQEQCDSGGGVGGGGGGRCCSSNLEENFDEKMGQNICIKKQSDKSNGNEITTS